jgi:hypothetical protein
MPLTMRPTGLGHGYYKAVRELQGGRGRDDARVHSPAHTGSARGGGPQTRAAASKSDMLSFPADDPATERRRQWVPATTGLTRPGRVRPAF